jgi:hypothetical protein
MTPLTRTAAPRSPRVEEPGDGTQLDIFDALADEMIAVCDQYQFGVASPRATAGGHR